MDNSNTPPQSFSGKEYTGKTINVGSDNGKTYTAHCITIEFARYLVLNDYSIYEGREDESESLISNIIEFEEALKYNDVFFIEYN